MDSVVTLTLIKSTIGGERRPTMPEKDGQTALREIRAHEGSRGILSNRGSKIVMTTAMSQLDDVSRAFYSLCDGYLVKPIDGQKLLGELRKLELIA